LSMIDLISPAPRSFSKIIPSTCSVTNTLVTPQTVTEEVCDSLPMTSSITTTTDCHSQFIVSRLNQPAIRPVEPCNVTVQTGVGPNNVVLVSESQHQQQPRPQTHFITDSNIAVELTSTDSALHIPYVETPSPFLAYCDYQKTSMIEADKTVYVPHSGSHTPMVLSEQVLAKIERSKQEALKRRALTKTLEKLSTPVGEQLHGQFRTGIGDPVRVESFAASKVSKLFDN
jgi:hypothetical protein